MDSTHVEGNPSWTGIMDDVNNLLVNSNIGFQLCWIPRFSYNVLYVVCKIRC